MVNGIALRMHDEIRSVNDAHGEGTGIGMESALGPVDEASGRAEGSRSGNGNEVESVAGAQGTDEEMCTDEEKGTDEGKGTDGMAGIDGVTGTDEVAGTDEVGNVGGAKGFGEVGNVGEVKGFAGEGNVDGVEGVGEAKSVVGNVDGVVDEVGYTVGFGRPRPRRLRQRSSRMCFYLFSRSRTRALHAIPFVPL